MIPTRDSVRPACDYLRVSYGGMSQQQPAAGTGALAAEVLGGTTCCISPLGRGCHYPNYRATGWVIHKLENNYTKNLFHCCESSGSTTDFPPWVSDKGMGIPWECDLEGHQDLITEFPQDWENRDSWRAQTKPCVHQDPGERSIDPTGH